VKFLTGTVYSKALAIFLAAALGLLGAAAALTQLIILREFDRSEQREMKAMLRRFAMVMARESLPNQTALAEWSRSSKISGVGESGDEAVREVLRETKMDFLAFIDGNGHLEKVTFASEASKAFAPSVVDALEFEEVLPWLRERTGDAGFIVAGTNLCAVISLEAPAVGGASSSGYLVAGKVFSKDSWGFFEGLFSATVEFRTFHDAVVNETSGFQLMNLLNKQEVVIDAAADSQIVGYSLIKGLNGEPLGYVSISQARPLRQEGLHAIQIFLSGICLAGGGLVLVVWFLLDRTILARIKDLTRKLEREKRSGRLPVKLDFRGEDELGVLARSIEDLATRLESTQFLYRAVLEDQTELICRFDPDFRLTFANAIFLRMFGVSEDSPPQLLCDLIPAEAWKMLALQFEQLSRERPLASFTHEIRLGDGSKPQWMRSTLRRNFDSNQATSGGQWVVADITAQVSAQRKMIESERRFRRLFETASDGLLLVEGDTLIVSDINPTLCRMLMVAGSDVMGRRLDAIALFAPCVEVVKAYRKRGLDKGAFRSECRLSRADETSLFAELRCGEYDVDGVDFVQLSFRNISERVLGERELRRLSAKLLRLQDDERRRIARELHDSTAQNLSAMEMNMSLLEPLIEDPHSRAARLIADTRLIANECSKELRNISYLLHPPLIDEVGLAFAIKWFTDGFSKRTGIVTSVEIEENFPRLGSDLEMPLFRVVQEGLTNIYRHSGADRAWVLLQLEPHSLSLEIRDNGKGFSEGILEGEAGGLERPTGVGLAGMKERLANVGGTLEIESSPLGATLTIRVPLVDGEHGLEVVSDLAG
jgi:PAS domain S-box-containing protein